jgi:hypothetical protein
MDIYRLGKKDSLPARHLQTNLAHDADSLTNGDHGIIGSEH